MCIVSQSTEFWLYFILVAAGGPRYEISMIIYGLFSPVLTIVWVFYTIALIHQEKEQKARHIIAVFVIIYIAFALIVVTNPIHELYFSLSKDMAYARGTLFIPLIVGSQGFYAIAGIVIMIANWKRIPSKPIAALLLFLYFFTTASYFIQLAFPGWLIICSAFAVAFLVCDATFESQRRDALYRTIKQSLEQLQEEKEKELAYQKKLEEAAQEANRANQAKSNFLSRMSHDIRTPMNGIQGMLKIIRKEWHDEKRVNDCLDKIETTSGHLLSLINDVLDMSKLESGQIVLTHKPFDIRQIATECNAIAIPLAFESGIEFLYETEENIPHPYLLGSPLHLRQILLNIIGNAIKYTKQGGTVRYSFQEIEFTEERIFYRFTISDTGIGISPEFFPSLFQPFSQEHVGSRSRYEGTGLGLAIVKKIIDQMEGKITVESKVGVGSTFTFTLPFAIDPNPPIQTASSQEEEMDPDYLADIRLLLVDDNSLNLEIAKFMVEDVGAIVDEAVNGQEAVNKFQQSQPGTYKAILMDIMMPVMDGLTATKTIRALQHPDAQSIPIIAMTANAFAEDALKCQEAGMNAHLAKPLDSATLVKTLIFHINHGNN